MVPADIIKKIKKVHIRTGRTVNTLMAGQYKSVFRGVGMEFEEVGIGRVLTGLINTIKREAQPLIVDD